jgi:tetratricopeptide (TPR) repeat protein
LVAEAEYAVVVEVEELFDSRPHAQVWSMLETFDRTKAGPDVVEASLGIYLCRVGDTREARKHLKAIQRRGNSPWSLILAAEIAIHDDDLDQARELCDRALIGDPHNCEALDIACSAALMQGRFEDADAFAAHYVLAYHVGALRMADAFLDASLARFPESPELILLKAARLRELGKRGEATAWRRKLPFAWRFKRPPRMMRSRMPYIS